MRPLFSIVTVCYNSGKTIERTIKSVLAQEFKDYEYIIVDGASKDNTMDVVLRYEPLFEGRMRYTSEPDRGIYDAFNKGIKQAQGEYVWIVNSDDYIAKDALFQLASLAKANIGCLAVIEGITNLEQRDGTFKLSVLSTDMSRCKAYRYRRLYVTHPSSVFNRTVYETVGEYDTNYHIIGDMDMCNRCYAAGVEYIPLAYPITTLTYGGASTKLNHRKYEADQWYLSKKFGKNRTHTLLLFSHFTVNYFVLRCRGLYCGILDRVIHI